MRASTRDVLNAKIKATGIEAVIGDPGELRYWPDAVLVFDSPEALERAIEKLAAP